MTVASLKIGNREFVVIPKREYERLQKWREKATRSRKRRNAEDRADLAISLRRLNDPEEKRIAWSQVKRAAGSRSTRDARLAARIGR